LEPDTVDTDEGKTSNVKRNVLLRLLSFLLLMIIEK